STGSTSTTPTSPTTTRASIRSARAACTPTCRPGGRASTSGGRASSRSRAINPPKGWITSWNGKPAHQWRAADSTFAFGPVFRSLSLDERLRPAAFAGNVTRSQMVSNMYDDGSAVAAMDEWYPRMITAVFDGQLSGLYGKIPMLADDRPGPVGSSYIEGYYGYLQRVFKMALDHNTTPYEELRCADGTAPGCRAALVQSLRDAVAALTTRYGSANPASWTVPATCTITDPQSCDQV